MNENLEDLKQKAGQLAANNRWDELIPVCTELIDLAQETSEKAYAYLQRGFAYLQKRDLDQAIADFTKTLEHKDDYAQAYLGLGIVWSNKRDHDRAITYFNKAVELHPRDAMMYVHRGVTYDEKGDYDRAIADFSEAINLDPRHALAYHNRGLTYSHRGRTYTQRGMTSEAIAEFDEAIRDFSEAIGLNLKEASTYSGRGGAYIEKGNYGFALNDFISADECDPNLKMRAPAIYIASQIAAIYKGTNQADAKATAFKFYFKLFRASDTVKINRFWGPQAEVAHYTSLHTLKSLADKGRFRLYNAAYMNDPEEGRVFFEIMNSRPEINIDIEDSFYQDSKLHPSPAYIGSFVITDENQQESKDELFLWRTYGKHDAEEAAGACLIFKGHNFAETAEIQIGGMHQQSPTGNNQPFQHSQQEESTELPTLYKVSYIESENKALNEELGDLAKCLKQIEDEVINKADDKKEQLRNLVCQILDSIRFLFKKSHYQAEKEVRIIQVHYFRENEESTTDGIQVDTEQIPPRFYLETSKDFRFSEVILGPKTRHIEEWLRWLKQQGHDYVKQSAIKYGTKYI
ncbi:MAG: tetratricopeptide repeat protein [Nitrospira sp. SB0675_bin_23]|nr:tetratricopeptide repeat protein [Paracoccaceae bacterium]MYH02255.1 tetratricopeptide repeat protein [Nitrospira sp. SB0675_bin_23]